jgi:UPF0271 protein
MPAIDLNADLGESFGAYRIGCDAELLKLITSANVACGFHGGDPVVMRETLLAAARGGVGIGAHPGFADLQGFGRRPIRMAPDEVEAMVVYQIGALIGMARATGTAVTHCKVHGALNNMACVEPDLAMACARAVAAVDPEMLFVVMPGSALEAAGAQAGLPLAREVFADRGYDDAAMLVPRGQPGAMLHDPEEAATRMLRFVETGAIESLSGKRIPVQIDTVCVHGDSPEALETARLLRQRFAAAGVALRPMHRGLAR